MLSSGGTTGMNPAGSTVGVCCWIFEFGLTARHFFVPRPESWKVRYLQIEYRFSVWRNSERTV